MIGSLGRMVTIVGAVAGAATAVYNVIVDWEEEASGFNQELERTKELENDLVELAKERLRLRRELAEEEIDDREDNSTASPTFDNLRDELAAQEQVVENLGTAVSNARAAVLSADQAVRAFEGSINPLRLLLEPIARSERSIASDNQTEAEAELERQRERLKELQGLVDDLDETQEEADTAKADRQRDLNTEIENEISLRREATQRAQGDDAGADSTRIERERTADLDRFSSLGDEEANAAADRLAAARAEERAAEEAADKREERLRTRDRMERDLGRFTDRTVRERLRAEERIGRLAERNARIQRERNTPLGGFDRGFSSFSDRIANSAASPDPNEAELRRIAAETEMIRQQASKEHAERLAEMARQTEAIQAINVGMT